MSVYLGANRLNRNIRLDATTEQALIDQCRRQNYEAFGKIVDAYQHRILGFVRRMVGSLEEAEDIAQEVFVRAYQNVEKFDGRSSLRTWLFRIAYNLCVDASRKRQRMPADVQLSEGEDGEQHEVADVRWNPESMMLNEELRQVIEDSIASMSEKLRSVLLLHDREELGYEELSGMLGIPVGTVKSRLFLARNHIQQRVSAYMASEGR